jgi:ATP-binding cassette subfamily B protein
LIGNCRFEGEEPQINQQPIIALDGASKSYGAVRAARDVSISLHPGEVRALAGENGAGKSTIVKLLTGMYRPTAGTVRVDGADLADLDLDAWRARTTATFQDYLRLELLAREAVGVGDLPRLDDEDAVLAALERAGADDVVARLPDGLDTALGRRFGGHELSGGQWQRVALARGLMPDDPLLVVLDEPTASVDAPTERALFERYARAARAAAESYGAVTLLVTHRFATARIADLIVVLEGGRVVDAGSHDELVARGGTYAELYALQAAGYRG